MISLIEDTSQIKLVALDVTVLKIPITVGADIPIAFEKANGSTPNPQWNDANNQ